MLCRIEIGHKKFFPMIVFVLVYQYCIFPDCAQKTDKENIGKVTKATSEDNEQQPNSNSSSTRKID